jgi:hypothetical protein
MQVVLRIQMRWHPFTVVGDGVKSVRDLVRLKVREMKTVGRNARISLQQPGVRIALKTQGLARVNSQCGAEDRRNPGQLKLK